jgi:hypothetical protein
LTAGHRARDAWGVSRAAVLDLVATVGRMRRDAQSRNRNFDAFARAETEAKGARRLWRYLRSLEKDLLANRSRFGSGVNLRIERRSDGGRRIVLDIAEVRMRRTVLLSAEEYALLVETPEIRDLLEPFEQSFE